MSSPPPKRRKTVADRKTAQQTYMTQAEIDNLDSPVWTEAGMIGALEAIFGGLSPDPDHPPRTLTRMHYMVLKADMQKYLAFNAPPKPQLVLYHNVTEEIKKRCHVVAEKSKVHHGLDLLKFYDGAYEIFIKNMKVFTKLCSYFNDNWIKREEDHKKQGGETEHVISILRTCISAWGQSVLTPLRDQLGVVTTDLIKRDRNSEKVVTRQIGSYTQSLVELGIENKGGAPEKGIDGETLEHTCDEDGCSEKVAERGGLCTLHYGLDAYRSFYQEGFLENSKQFYTQESKEFLASNSVAEYMKKVDVRMREEKHRVESYMHETTWTALEKLLIEVLVADHIDEYKVAFKMLLSAGSMPDLKRMFDQVGMVDGGHGMLRELFQEHVTAEGQAAIVKLGKEGGSDPKAYVTALLSTYNFYGAVVKTAFVDTVSFLAALKKSANTYMNVNLVTKTHSQGSRASPVLLSKYCDGLLKKSSKMHGGGDVDPLLDGCITVFNFLQDADVFQKFYSKSLAKRLVEDNSVSEDAEESMISKLKATAGAEWTRKFQTMFTDVKTSRESTKKFDSKEILKDFNAMILKSGSWPFAPNPEQDVTFTGKMKACCDKYKMWYVRAHSGRKLTWLPIFSKGDLIAQFSTDKKTGKPLTFTLQASAHQMAILLLFNDATTIAVADIEKMLAAKGWVGEQNEYLKAVLSTLYKTKIITASADGKVCKLNEAWKNKKTRVKIDLPVKAAVAKEAETDHKAIDLERTFVIKAKLVQVMKTRKTMNHKQLVLDVMKALIDKFKPQPRQISKEIGNLIETEYLERVEGKRDEYNYLA